MANRQKAKMTVPQVREIVDAGGPVTVSEVAVLLRASKGFLGRCCKTGRNQSLKIGRDFRIPAHIVLRLLQEGIPPDAADPEREPGANA